MWYWLIVTFLTGMSVGVFLSKWSYVAELQQKAKSRIAICEGGKFYIVLYESDYIELLKDKYRRPKEK